MKVTEWLILAWYDSRHRSPMRLSLILNIELNWNYRYCMQTLTRHSWMHYTDCWIVKYVD